MSDEIINLPDYLCADYSIKNSLAQQGLMLLNASIILPGYKGNLSCFLVNFSDKTIKLAKDESIARIIFCKISKPDKVSPLEITSQKYQANLEKSATLFSSTFLNINEIESRIEKKVYENTNNQITSGVRWGGGIIAILLLFSTLQPLITKWIWGVDLYVPKETITSQQHQIETLIKETESMQKEIKIFLEKEGREKQKK